MDKMSEPRGNIGEWSELYTLGYLLVHGGAFAADEEQSAIPDIFYKVLQVYLAESASVPETNYIIGPSDVAILVSGNTVGRIDRSVIQQSIELMLNELTDGTHKKTFALATGNELMQLLQRNRISAASSNHENDLDLVLEDQVTQVATPRVGFNIKSQIGARATLLNASGATNFIYKIVPNNPNSKGPYPHFEHGKHITNIASLYASGFHLEFLETANSNFYENLTLLDMKFPEYLAKVLLQYYLTGDKTFSSAVQNVFPEDVPGSRQPIFKLKEFLGAVAMGLRPSKPWDGDTTKFSGILVVKKNGEIVFYYLYNRKKFEDYLFNNLAFERGDTKKHKYGEIYTDQGVDKIKLNLQIRFTN
jgi:hypothetical protein